MKFLKKIVSSGNNFNVIESKKSAKIIFEQKKLPMTLEYIHTSLTKHQLKNAADNVVST